MMKISTYCTLIFLVLAALPCQGMSWFYKKPAPKPQEALDPVNVILQPYVTQIKSYAQRFPKTIFVLGAAAVAIVSYKAFEALNKHIETVTYPKEKYLEILSAEKKLVDMVKQQGTASIEQSNLVSSVPKLDIPAGVFIEPAIIERYAHAYASCIQGGDDHSYYYFTQAHERLIEKITG